MSVALLIIFIVSSYLVVTVGAVTLEMTGLEKSMARFQALSAFSGTGFTTREAEMIVGHPRRRKVTMYLMILGNAGLASVIATSVLSLRRAGLFGPSLNLAIILVIIFILSRFATRHEFVQRLSERITHTLREKLHFEKAKVEELLRQADGYGVALILVGAESKIAGKTLLESGLREKQTIVLSIERDEGVMPVPKANAMIRPGDRLICYGKLENLQELT